jgi:thioredoxin 1
MGFFSNLFPPKHEVLPVHIGSAADFDREIKKSDLPVILDVWSEGCVPCRQLAPVLTDVATRFEGRVKVAEVSTSGPIALLQKLGVSATPTIVIFHRGRELGRVVGYHPRSWFEEMIVAEFPEVGAGEDEKLSSGGARRKADPRHSGPGLCSRA